MIYFAEVECLFYNGHSLKDKRSIIKRITNQLRQNITIAVAELDFQDLWQRTKLGIVTVSNERSHAEQVIQEALRIIDTYPELERTLTHIERL